MNWVGRDDECFRIDRVSGQLGDGCDKCFERRGMLDTGPAVKNMKNNVQHSRCLRDLNDLVSIFRM